MNLWATARLDLALSEAEFYRLTPREFFALVDRHHERERLARDAADYRTGMVLAMVANLHRDRKKHPAPWLPHHFFPSLPAPQPPTPQPTEVLLRKVEMLNQLFGGRDLRKHKPPPPQPSHNAA